MKAFGTACAVIAGIALLVVLAFTFEIGGLQWKSFFAPKYAAVERQVFKETRSYNEAKVQALVKYRRQYITASDEDKEALAGLIRVEFAEFYADGKADELEPSLRKFLRNVMEN